MSKKTISIDDVRYGIKKTSISERGLYVNQNICSCGNKNEGEYVSRADVPSDYECEKCGNKMFHSTFKLNSPFTAPFFTVDFKNNRGFGVSRTNVTIQINSIDGGEEIKDIEIKRINTSRKVVFDFVDSTLICYRDGAVEYDFSKDIRFVKKMNLDIDEEDIIFDYDKILRRINGFVFRSVSFDDFMKQVGTSNSKEFYKYVNENINRKNSYSTPNKQILSRFASMLLYKDNHAWAQVLSSAGFKSLGRLEGLSLYISSGGGRYDYQYKNIKKSATSPYEILQVPKSFIKYLIKMEKINVIIYAIKALWVLESKRVAYDYNTVLKIMSYAKEKGSLITVAENLEILYDVVSSYKGRADRLMEYLLEDLPMYQGISSVYSGICLLRDYSEMCKKMGSEPEKYPKSLKKVHDIAMVNYSKFKENLSEDDFKIAVSKYGDLAKVTRGKKYSFLLPESAKEMVMEGNALHHCIASYTSRVMENRTNIIFMRRNEDLETPLVSIEVTNGRIAQARGKNNRSVTEEEGKAIKAWAKEKGLS